MSAVGGGGMSSMQQMGGAGQPNQGQRKSAATPTSASPSGGVPVAGVAPGSGVIGQQWGPFSSTGAAPAAVSSTPVAGLGGSAPSANAATNAFGGGGLGGLGGPTLGAPPGPDGLFGITDLMATARLGMFDNPPGRGMWPDSGMQDSLSFQAGLGGAEWQPQSVDQGIRPADPQLYSFTDTLEDSVPRYQQF